MIFAVPHAPQTWHTFRLRIFKTHFYLHPLNVCQVCGAANFKKIIITILFINKNLSNFYHKRIFSCSASLLRGWKEVLNADFDFIYNKLKNRLCRSFPKKV